MHIGCSKKKRKKRLIRSELEPTRHSHLITIMAYLLMVTN